MKKKHFIQLNLHLRSILRRLQSLPDTTANEAIYLMSGIPPIEALVDKAIVSLVTCISHKPSSIVYRLAIQQLAIKPRSSHSWFIYAMLRLKQCNVELPPFSTWIYV